MKNNFCMQKNGKGISEIRVFEFCSFSVVEKLEKNTVLKIQNLTIECYFLLRHTNQKMMFLNMDIFELY